MGAFWNSKVTATLILAVTACISKQTQCRAQWQYGQPQRPSYRSQFHRRPFASQPATPQSRRPPSRRGSSKRWIESYGGGWSTAESSLQIRRAQRLRANRKRPGIGHSTRSEWRTDTPVPTNGEGHFERDSAASRQGTHIPAAYATAGQLSARRTDSSDGNDSSFDQKSEWVWEFLPDGLIYKSYLAGAREPRFGSVWLHESGRGWIWESVLGGRVGIFRHGTPGTFRPEGWQLDFEGAVFTRLDWDQHVDLDATDFRVGIPLTYRRGQWAFKFGYSHISSHLGDEFMLKNPGFKRRNYVRDSLVLGVAHNLTDDWLMYAEVGVAPSPSGGAEPLEFQFGTEYSPAIANGKRGSPFAAINGHLRQEFNFGGSVNLVAGWQWRAAKSNRLLRIGGQYFNGKSLQYSFFNKHEELAGFGIWYDY